MDYDFGVYTKDKKLKIQVDLAWNLYLQDFPSVHSEEYKLGFKEMLRWKFGGMSRPSYPYDEGTAEHDAYVYGVDRADWFYRWKNYEFLSRSPKGL